MNIFSYTEILLPYFFFAIWFSTNSSRVGSIQIWSKEEYSVCKTSHIRYNGRSMYVSYPVFRKSRCYLSRFGPFLHDAFCRSLNFMGRS